MAPSRESWKRLDAQLYRPHAVAAHRSSSKAGALLVDRCGTRGDRSSHFRFTPEAATTAGPLLFDPVCAVSILVASATFGRTRRSGDVRFRHLLILLGIVAAPLLGAVAASARPALPVVEANWRLVTRGLLAAANDDLYVALVHGRQLTLIDDRVNTRRVILRIPQSCDLAAPGNPTVLLLGRPWLMLACGPEPYGPSTTYLIFNIDAGRWGEFHISSQCRGVCVTVAVGRYWVKVLSDEGQMQYPPADYYLQNLQTGQWERDPATPNGQVFDDLNGQNPTQPLCPPLVYPQSFGARSSSLGSITFLGPFALTVGTPAYPANTRFNLRRCGSALNRSIQAGVGAPLGSSRAVIAGPFRNGFHGLFLPTLRRFVLRPPPNPRAKPTRLIAVTRRKVYVEVQQTTAPFGAGTLWVATLPTEAQLKPKRHKERK
jgi:hypothetical protein